MRANLKNISIILVSMLAGSILYHFTYSWLSQESRSGLDGKGTYENGNRQSQEVRVNRAMQVDRSKFSVSKTFHFPQPRFSKSVDQLLHSDWVKRLQDILHTVDGRQVSVVTASVEHTDILLNWLISAYIYITPPIKNVMVLTIDEELHKLLHDRGISSLWVSPGMVINPNAKVERVFSQVHVVRLAVVRLMNHYGYDVVNYDCDAILLKNPQVIFDRNKDADLIGTFGKGPEFLFKKWGVALNTGVMLLRANPKIEYYWEHMLSIKKPVTDDQMTINQGLDVLGIKWMNLKNTQNIDYLEQDIYGVAKVFKKSKTPVNMVVMLMPYTTVCRHVCDVNRRNEYFVWHALAIKENRTVENKMSQAKVGGAWFLSDNWKTTSEQNPDLTGVDWIKHLAVADEQMFRIEQAKLLRDSQE